MRNSYNLSTLQSKLYFSDIYDSFLISLRFNFFLLSCFLTLTLLDNLNFGDNNEYVMNAYDYIFY